MARCFAVTLVAGLLIGATLLGSIAASAGAPPVHTATPTPTPTELPTATPTPAPDLMFQFSDDTFTWTRVPGAATYHVTGSVGIVRVNAADPFCTPPLAEQSLNVSVDETLPSDATSLTVAYPPLPAEDAWFSPSQLVDLVALDARGAGMASAHIGTLTETNGDCGLPATGGARPPSSPPGTASWLLVAAGVFGLLGAAALMLARRVRG